MAEGGLRCAECHKPDQHGDLSMCPCERVFYCNAGCQEKNWEAHKAECSHGRKTEVPVTRCEYCGNVSNQNMWCPCAMVLYCSKDCQRKHWDGGHYQECHAARNASTAAFAHKEAADAAKGASPFGMGLGARFLKIVDGVKQTGKAMVGFGGAAAAAKQQPGAKQPAAKPAAKQPAAKPAAKQSSKAAAAASPKQPAPKPSPKVTSPKASPAPGAKQPAPKPAAKPGGKPGGKKSSKYY